jgi:hypothetical protein
MLVAGGALLLSYAVALAAWVIVRKAGAFTRVAAGAWGGAVAACAALASFDEHPVLRVLTFIGGGLWGLRVYSYLLQGAPQGLADYLRFLSVGLLSPYLVYSPTRFRSARPSLARECLRLVVAGGTTALTWWLTMKLIAVGPGQRAWLVNHLIAVVGFVIVMTAFGQANFALWRLLGLPARPVVDQVWLARTPADFWRRWSWPIHHWLYQYIYRPCGGRRHAIRSVLAVFACSGLLHEAIAFVALGRVTGHQTAFFAVSALGVLASPTLDRIARRGIAAEVLVRFVTVLFLAASAALMFVTIDALIPLYVTRVWLLW